jgi:hypothetical protein
MNTKLKVALVASAVFLAYIVIVPGPCHGLPALPAAGAAAQSPDVSPVPAGYVHRPVAEFFTGLSCPSCMAGPHPDMERLWEENGYDPKQDFTYVVFHELNGGGVDDLNNDEATERMRYYQPGVSGTPDVNFDGGYIELGGMTGGTLNYETAKSAVQTCKDRVNTVIDPRHPIQSLRNGFKFVKLDVRQMFDGEGGFAVMVEASYLGTTALVETKSLNGLLYVFMVEDNVTAFSKVEKTNVSNHNAFRGYAFKGESFTLTSGQSKKFSTSWTIPDAKVPIKPADVNCVAVVYDADDTTSQPGAQGNPNRVPRAVQSATPLSTAYDAQLAVPAIGTVEMTRSGDKVKLTAKFDAPNGVAAAYAFYNTEAANATEWTPATFNLTGSECEDGETCAIYKDAVGTLSLSIPSDKQLYMTVLMYDGNMTQGRADLNNITAHSAVPKANASIPVWAVGAALGLLAVVGIVYLWKKGKLPIGKKQQAA